MEIFLVRHGAAVEREGEGPDAFRPLFDSIAATEFRFDVSSTQLREQGTRC